MEIKVLPEKLVSPLAMVMGKSFAETRKIIEEYNIDANVFMNAESYQPILLYAIWMITFGGEVEEILKTINYLIARGADPNIRSKAGTTPLLMAVAYEKAYPIALALINNGADVNMTDRTHKNPPLWDAIRNYPTNADTAGKKKSIELIEALLAKGANPDHVNKHGTTPRGWLEYTKGQLNDIFEKYDALKPEYVPSTTVQPKFPTKLSYPKIANKIWQDMVPAEGQSTCVQGELLRCVEKLRWEAQNNGNINWDEGFAIMAKYVRKSLVDSKLFGDFDVRKIKGDVARLLKYDNPQTKDSIYDNLTDRICEFYMKFPEPIAREINKDLDR